MNHKLLTLSVFGFLTAVVFILFILRLQPIRPPESLMQQATVEKIDKPIISFIDPAIGAKEPKVTIVEYSDFLCDSCRSMASSLAEVISRYPEDVRLVWKHMPNESLHALSTSASLAAQCAAQQNKFWEYHDLIFENQAVLTESSFEDFTLRADIDLDVFRNCFETQNTLPIIRKDYDEGLALQISATPTIFINNERFSGAISTEELLTHVRQKITK